MNKAKLWAKSYFERLEKGLKVLENHPLIEHLNFTHFTAVSDEQIIIVEKEMDRLLKENAANKGIERNIDFKFDSYIKEFYKISNGLNLSWDSHLYKSTLTENKILNDESSENFIVAENELLQAEGFLSLLPLNNLLSYSNLGIYGDPQDSRLGEKLTKEGGHFTYIDYYSGYHDTCVNIIDSNKAFLYWGQDHSALYEASIVSDFVIYMEHTLSTYFSVFLRHESFYSLDKVKALQELDYFAIEEKIDSENRYNSIDEVLKYHSIKADLIGKFASLDYLKQKPEEIHRKIEDLLDIKIEDEFF